jgi:ribosomal protein L19E
MDIPSVKCDNMVYNQLYVQIKAKDFINSSRISHILNKNMNLIAILMTIA